MTTIDGKDPYPIQWKSEISTATQATSQEAIDWIKAFEEAIAPYTATPPSWAGSSTEAEEKAAEYILANLKGTGTLGTGPDFGLTTKIDKWSVQFEALLNQVKATDTSSMPAALQGLGEAEMRDALHFRILDYVAKHEGILPSSLGSLFETSAPQKIAAKTTSSISNQDLDALKEAFPEKWKDFSSTITTLFSSAEKRSNFIKELTSWFNGMSEGSKDIIKNLALNDLAAFESFKSTLTSISHLYDGNAQANQRLEGKILQLIAESNPPAKSLKETNDWLSPIKLAIKDSSNVTLNGTQLEIAVDSLLDSKDKNTQQEIQGLLSIIKQLNAYPEESEALLSGILLEVEEHLGTEKRDDLINKFSGKPQGALRLAEEAIYLLATTSDTAPSWVKTMDTTDLKEAIASQASRVFIEQGQKDGLTLIDIKEQLLMPASSFIRYAFNHAEFQDPLLAILNKWKDRAESQLAQILAKTMHTPNYQQVMMKEIISLFLLDSIMDDMEYHSEKRAEEERKHAKQLDEIIEKRIDEMSQEEQETTIRLFESFMESKELQNYAKNVFNNIVMQNDGFEKLSIVLKLYEDQNQGRLHEAGKLSELSTREVLVRMIDSTAGLTKSNISMVSTLLGDHLDISNPKHLDVFQDVADLVSKGKIAEAKEHSETLLNKRE